MAQAEQHLAKQEPKGPLATLQDLFEQYKGQIAMALPRHMTPERMIRIALTAVSTTPGLKECTAKSILGCVVQASILGLEPNTVLGEAYIIPFNNKIKERGQPDRWEKQAQLMVGYLGLVKLVRNSGELKFVAAEHVFENDTFTYRKGLDPALDHIEAKGDRGAPVGVWAAIVTKDGGQYFDYWPMERIYDHRDKFSKSKNSPAWTQTPEWMEKKTVLRQVCKLAPKSVEAQTAVSLDERAEAGIPQRFSIDVPLELHPTQPEQDEEPVMDMPQLKSSEPEVIDEGNGDSEIPMITDQDRSAMDQQFTRLKMDQSQIEDYLQNNHGVTLLELNGIPAGKAKEILASLKKQKH